MSDPELIATLNRGRAWRTGIMLDTVTITRGGSRVFNAATRVYAIVPGTPVYTGKARVMPWRGNEEQAGEAEVSVYRYRIQLPLNGAAQEIKRYDTVTITASSHPAMAGKVLTVTEPELGTTATALTVIAELTS